jgi:hypothetical protein
MPYLHAHTVKIDEDEGRFVLVVEDDEIGRVRIDIHDVALALEDEVRRELRPYALEAAEARRAVAGGRTLAQYLGQNDGDGYALDDPKHPTYYERMVG